MWRTVAGVFLVLHGFVHAWYVVLAQELVPYEPAMGWTGRSWALTSWLGEPTAHMVATVWYGLAGIAFVVGGIAVLAQAAWWRPALAVASIISALAITVFWDGNGEMLMQKGVIGLVISLVTLVVALVA
jgi:hypothetical protein